MIIVMITIGDLKIRARKFKVKFIGPSGDSIIQFDPTFDRVPSTNEPVNNRESAEKYGREIFKPFDFCFIL